MDEFCVFEQMAAKWADLTLSPMASTLSDPQTPTSVRVLICVCSSIAVGNVGSY